ncbi:hypothetical protein HanHA89_Chr10g0379001 [Helianthus annuus]|nr:hypothetical protein HanHA89_Chr10g0379001 [Helianthus annuus]
MDQTEVLHLLESPDALKVKVTGMTLMVPRGRMYHGPARNKADANMAAGGGSGMLPVPYEMAGVGGMLPRDAAAPIPQQMPVTALASALANDHTGW